MDQDGILKTCGYSYPYGACSDPSATTYSATPNYFTFPNESSLSPSSSTSPSSYADFDAKARSSAILVDYYNCKKPVMFRQNKFLLDLKRKI
ncbi:hypothetical protein BpHYR1_028322 [Brachionus plicatilis]|uniref:Uncharacterized protein n=1 Tax=Brachionus plicatilis TaxID=10195 RepID=A0A3M7R4J9_BRAPC|nr:hypothetical protein BpHYR1_028322 [Brachionus plicatilis]